MFQNHVKANQCPLCYNPADTKEHIIPKWLQEHFNLADQHFMLLNKTTMPYKNAVIPLCQQCNGNKLSHLEKRIKTGQASDQDYYLWALKIRFLYSLKDNIIPFDRKDNSKGTLLSPEEAYHEKDFIVSAINSLDAEKFYFNPNPFGSVIIFENPMADTSFGFVDIAYPYLGLSIALPNNKILCVLFADRGMVKQEIRRLYRQKGGDKTFLLDTITSSTKDTIKILMAKLLMWQYEIINIPTQYIITKNGIRSSRIPKRANRRKKIERDALIKIFLKLDLPLEFAHNTYNSLPPENKK